MTVEITSENDLVVKFSKDRSEIDSTMRLDSLD